MVLWQAVVFKEDQQHQFKHLMIQKKKEWVYTEHDMSAEPFDDAKVKAIATALWTDDAKAAYKKWVEDNRTPS